MREIEYSLGVEDFLPIWRYGGGPLGGGGLAHCCAIFLCHLGREI